MAGQRSSRPRIGDIVEIETLVGLAYAQYTHKHQMMGYLIRVLPGLHSERPHAFSDLVRQPERFYVFFPLGAAVARAIVKIVAHAEVPEQCRPFPLFRSGTRNTETGEETWWLWDGEREWRVGRLDPEQRKLPSRSIWNDTLLVERIVAGWSPEDEVPALVPALSEVQQRIANTTDGRAGKGGRKRA